MHLHSLAKRLCSKNVRLCTQNCVSSETYFHCKSFASVRKNVLGERKCFASEIKHVATDR